MSRPGRQPHYSHTCALPANGRVAVVGESQYQPDVHIAANGMPADGSRAGFIPAVAVLIPEPENQHDSNAVRVDLLVGRRHHTVGYLSRTNAPRYQPALLALFARGMVGSCPAEITGGGDGKNYAVALRLGPARSLPPDVADDPLTIPTQLPRSAPMSQTQPRGRRAGPRLPPVAPPRTPAMAGSGRSAHRKPLWIGEP